MFERPNFPLLSQASDEALENLYKFKMQNALQVTTGIPSHPPSQPPPRQRSAHVPPANSFLSPPRPRKAPAPLNVHPYDVFDAEFIRHNQQQQRDARYLYPPTSHMPTLVSQPPPPYPYVPKIYPEPLTCITREMVFDRVYLLLLENLAKRTNNTHLLIHISNGITDSIIRAGHEGAFGPDGLSSLTDIFVCIGHRGRQYYMCLATRGVGVVYEFLTGELCEHDGKDPMRDRGMMQRCREGFHEATVKVYMRDSTQSRRV